MAKVKEEKTNVMRVLDQKKIRYTPHAYPYSGGAVDGPHVAELIGVEPERVNVKATTEEGLGFTGLGQGMAAHAVALLEPSEK